MTYVGSKPADYCVIGAGIVGLAVARQLLITQRGSSVIVLDKEPVVAAHQTGHNSGVIHAGIYYRPGSEKSVLCRRGVGLLEAFCDERGVPYDVCGKLILAADRSEEAALDRLLSQSVDAGVPGVRLIGPAEVADREPHALARTALLSPSTAIVDFAGVARALAVVIASAGGDIKLRRAVTGITDHGDVVSVRTSAGTVLARQVLICAGLEADRLAHLAGGPDEPRIVPFRGEYYRLVPRRRDLVRGLIYPVPDPRYPFLGVHFTKMIDGGVTVGPNAVLALSREGYRWGDVSLADVARLATWPGTWRLARAHWRTGGYEVAGSLSKRIFTRRAQRYVPALEAGDLGDAGAGVRAQAVDRRGRLLDDFAFSRSGLVLSVRNAPSPAATASLAIAERIVDEVRRAAGR